MFTKSRGKVMNSQNWHKVQINNTSLQQLLILKNHKVTSGEHHIHLLQHPQPTVPFFFYHSLDFGQDSDFYRNIYNSCQMVAVMQLNTEKTCKCYVIYYICYYNCNDMYII